MSNPDTQTHPTPKHRYKKHRHTQIHKHTHSHRHTDQQAHKRSVREKKNKRTAIITQGKKKHYNNNEREIKKRIYSSVRRTHI